MNDIKKLLFDKLKAFYPDKDFVGGVISIAGTPENYQKIIDFIDADEDVSVESIIALSVLLNDATEKPVLKDAE